MHRREADLGGGGHRLGSGLGGQLEAQCSHRRFLEQRAHRELGVECGVDCGDHPHRGDRIAAEVEERIVDTDPVQAQHLGVDAGERLFGRGGRGAVTGGVPILGRGQGTAIELAVDGQRQCLQDNDRRRHHVGGQPFAEFLAQLGRIGVAGDVADQTLVAGAVLARDDRGLESLRQARRGRLGSRRVRCGSRGS